MSDSRGKIHFYFGFGKGKTTAAIGLALRASGYGKKIVIVQFLKNRQTGEIMRFSEFDNVKVFRGTATAKFFDDMSEEERSETAAMQQANFDRALEEVATGGCDMLILDEVVDAYQMGLIDRKRFEDLVKDKPEHLELVITGHKSENWLIEQADYVTEMVKLKHPYDEGTAARKGIEF